MVFMNGRGLLIAALLAGCSSTPSDTGVEQQATVASKTANEIANSFPEALRYATPIPLTRDETYKGDIRATDRSLAIFDGVVHYKIFAIAADGRSGLTIDSLCSCFGFKKRIMPPAAFLLGEHGQQVGSPIQFSLKPSGLVLPVHYNASIGASEIPESARFLLVSADPRLLRDGNTRVRTLVLTPVPVAIINVNLPFDATGELRVTYGSAP
jgi:hypothetical protein